MPAFSSLLKLVVVHHSDDRLERTVRDALIYRRTNQDAERPPDTEIAETSPLLFAAVGS